jgi:hypothetical protein
MNPEQTRNEQSRNEQSRNERPTKMPPNYFPILCIKRVYHNVTDDEIRESIEYLTEYSKVTQIDYYECYDRDGNLGYTAVVHLCWNRSGEHAYKVRKQIYNKEEVRIEYRKLAYFKLVEFNESMCKKHIYKTCKFSEPKKEHRSLLRPRCNERRYNDERPRERCDDRSRDRSRDRCDERRYNGERPRCNERRYNGERPRERCDDERRTRDQSRPRQSRDQSRPRQSRDQSRPRQSRDTDRCDERRDRSRERVVKEVVKEEPRITRSYTTYTTYSDLDHPNNHNDTTKVTINYGSNIKKPVNKLKNTMMARKQPTTPPHTPPNYNGNKQQSTCKVETPEDDLEAEIRRRLYEGADNEALYGDLY